MSTDSSDLGSSTPAVQEQPLDIEALSDQELRIRLARSADQLEMLVSQLDQRLQELTIDLAALLDLAEKTIGLEADWPPLEGQSLNRISAACGAAALLLDGIVLVGGMPAGVPADRAEELLARLRTNPPHVDRP